MPTKALTYGATTIAQQAAASARPQIGTSRRILVIEDEPDIAHLLQLHLAELPAEVVVEHDGGAGLDRAQAEAWSALVLDLRLPGMGGLDICRLLRQEGSQIPILMVTSRVTELDRVLGLEMGADDYLTKPFGVLELQARVRALWRRADMQRPRSEGRGHATVECLDRGPLRMDKAQRSARSKGRPLTLTPTEFDLLWLFASHPGRVYSRSELLDQVWGSGHQGYEHTVNTHINRLRSKLGNELIRTVWGLGYRFEVPD